MALDAETLDQLVSSVERFVRERLQPLEQRVSEEDAVPDEVIDEMSALGLFGLSIPAEYGGLGLNMAEEVAVAIELGRTSPAFRSVVGTNIGIGSQGIVMFGTDDQKAEWLPKLATGEAVASFALTEPNAGSDSAAVETKAIRDGDDYIINGTKRFITNANKASVFTLMARSDPAKKGAKGVSSFIVPADLPGITIGKPDKKMGQQGAHICDIIFEDVRLPAKYLLGEEGEGFKNAMRILDRGRLHISAVCVGVAERLIKDALEYAMDRKQFGEPLSSFQMIQAMLAECQTEAYAGRTMIEDAARKRDRGEDVAMVSSCCKLYCSEMVGRVADKAVQIFGGSGYVSEYSVERFYRDVRIFRLYEGTSEIQKLVIARNMVRNAR